MVDSGTLVKIVGLVVIEVLGISGGFLPFLPKMREGFVTAFGEAFSGGVFLSAAILDLQADAFGDFSDYESDRGVDDLDDVYPFPFFMTVMGFLLSLIITRVSHHLRRKKTCPCGEGCQCGMSCCERERGFSFKTAAAMVVGFATAGPVGVAIGIGLTAIGNALVVSLLTGLAAGTFLYVAVEVIFSTFGGLEHSHEVKLYESKARAVLLFVMLSFHSIIEGLALGIQDKFADTIVVFIAILCHKAIEAFSIGCNLVRTMETNAPAAVKARKRLEKKRESDRVNAAQKAGSLSLLSDEQYAKLEDQPSAEEEELAKGGHYHLSQMESLVAIISGIAVFSVITIFV